MIVVIGVVYRFHVLIMKIVGQVGERVVLADFLTYTSINNLVVEGRRPETLTTGLFVLSIPGMAS